MAHGILSHLYPEAEVCSAGVKPASEVHPLAIKVMTCLHIGFDDPDAFTGPEEQVIEEFRRVRVLSIPCRDEILVSL